MTGIGVVVSISLGKKSTFFMVPFSFVALYNDTELKCRTKKVDFLTKKIETTTPIPFDQAWSRASKKVGVVVSIASYAEKSESKGAKKGPFCMGILVTLSLSKKKAPIGLKIFFSS